MGLCYWASLFTAAEATEQSPETSIASGVAGTELARTVAALRAIHRLSIHRNGEVPAVSLSSGGPKQGEGDSDNFHGGFSVCRHGGVMLPCP